MNPSNLEILAYEETQLGPLCLRRRSLLSDPSILVTEVTLNHEFLMSSYNTDSERIVSNRSIELHRGSELRALVGGFGLGYTAWELLRNPAVTSVEVVEYLPPVLQWLEEGLIPLAKELQSSDKLLLTTGDIYKRLLGEASDEFDLIVIDVDHSPDDLLSDADIGFYTEQGLQRAKAHLAEHGVLAVWSYAEASPFADALHQVFGQVTIEPVTTYNPMIQHEQTDWLFFAQL